MEATRARLPLEKKKASNVVSFAGTVLQWRMLGNRAIWSSAEALLLVLYSVSVHSTHSLNKVALKHSLLLGCGQPPPLVHILPAIGVTSKDPLLDHAPVEGFSKDWGY